MFQRLQGRMDDAPGLDYLMIRTIVIALTSIGLLMVTSASVTWSIYDGNPVWDEFLRQLLFVGIGVVVFWAAVRVSPSLVKSLSWVLLGISLLFLILVLFLGTGDADFGSRSWLPIGGFQFQPSEFAKIGFAVWGAAFISRSYPRKPSPGEYSVLFGFGVVFVTLILWEHDTGMAVTFATVLAAIFFFAGIRYVYIVVAFIAMVVVLIVAATFLGGYRFARLQTYMDGLSGNFENQQSDAFQSYQAYLSLADGGWTGVGIGQSRAKWFYLPEAKNDFIFAIIGEELGVVGALLVITLYAALAYFGFRVALRAADRFQSLLAATITTAVVVQAFINIGYVVGVLPVTGIQLPLISAGGTSAVVTLGAMGLLANIARHEPELVSHMASHGRPIFDRLFLLPEPKNDPRAQRAAKEEAARRKRPQRVPVTRLSHVPHADGETQDYEPDYDTGSAYGWDAHDPHRQYTPRGSGRSSVPAKQPHPRMRGRSYRTPPRSES